MDFFTLIFEGCFIVLFPRVVELHRKKGGKTILVIGGGIIPKRRIPCLNGCEIA